MKTDRFTIKPGTALPLGVTKVPDGVQFAVYLPDQKNCYLKLYRKGAADPEYRIPLTGQYKVGSVYFVIISQNENSTEAGETAQILSEEYEYLYEVDGKEVIDPYAAALSDRNVWGKRNKQRQSRGQIRLEEFDWDGDCLLRLPFSESVLYQLHVRGYTKHVSSGVQHRGTFAGVQEKIPYLKELGINGILLLPAYEFQEIQGDKLNYWGYGAKDTCYFAPKASYSAVPDRADREMKEMVQAMHRAGIEVLLDIYFLPETNLTLMTDCLRHWVLNYHIDGFRINTEVMPSLSLVSDPILSGVKLLTSYWDQNMLSATGVRREENALAEYNEGFMNDARRFLKSDEGQVEHFVQRFRRNPEDFGVINFITHVNGFTMMDLVSYDIKHNDSNGELNRDGTEYNYSWNCGVEGKSRKKVIVERRMRQIRNAFFMLLCSQGTPMILAGDEFGNSQQGNNNAYCHDDNVTWLDWRENATGTEISEYVRKLIAFRKEHPVLHQEKELLMMDTLSCGMPDLSVHGLQTWRPDYSNYSRMLGLLLDGRYAKMPDGSEDDSIYIIYNMYWEAKSFDLPVLPDGKQWYAAIETFDNTFSELPPKTKRTGKKKRKKTVDLQKKTVVPPRSVVVFVGR